ncbi:dienelactone hydrolase family protein [Acidisphaera sp. L21]|uniref:dienelactone hydrolase family protein n=1 Tax=Acidisphaera sp. L21 TaxID=1641851 RepID=UPI00131CA59E|nr:dienelactone hydrolase family protein [Acidisphaera sp. L21]
MNELAGLTRFPLARRGFVMSSLISGFTLATTRVDAQAIQTDTAGLDAGETKITTSDSQLPAYYARPQGAGPFPTVLVVEEIFGVHEYIKDICRRLAKQGFLAVATEYYARLGELQDMTSAMQLDGQIISRAPDGLLMSDMDSTAEWAASNHGDPARLSIIGFCRGGRNVWLYAAHNPKLKAAVAFYGPMGGAPTAIQPKGPLDVAGQIKCPILGLYAGTKDPSSSPEQIKQAEAAAKSTGLDAQIIVYPDAAHGFHADYRPSYNKTDADDAWTRMLAWLRTHKAG